MTAAAKDVYRTFEKWNTHRFTLLSPNKAYKNAACGLILSGANTGKVAPMGTAGLTLRYIGRFGLMAPGPVDATSADQPVNVNLLTEINLEEFGNSASTDAVASTDTGKLCYFYDDQTVGIKPDGHAVAGIVWAVSASVVLVEKSAASSLTGRDTVGTLPAYVSNDSAPTSIVNGAVYDVLTTGAASTVTLPAAPLDGANAWFAADGTKNGHTVQYRDATGTVNLTTALLASKRHLVRVEALGGKWFANAYVSP